MKTQKLMALALLLSAFLFACTPAASQPAAVEQEAAPSEAQPEPAAEEPEPQAEEPEADARFTIEAPEELREAVTAVYTALFSGEQPAFVAAGGDLVLAEAHENAAATMLPGVVLAAGLQNPDVAEFITFAVSPDGQQALIDAGALPATITVTDQAGNEVEIPQPVRRLISSHGPTTFINYGVGAGDRLVAASYLGARDPLGAETMGRIDPDFESIMGGDFFTQQEFNAEEAVKLEPDLITTSARTGWLDVAAELGIPTVLFEAETPERLKEAILLAGSLYGPHSAAQARAYVDYYDRVVQAVADQTADLSPEERLTVLVTGSDPMTAASGEMYQTAIVEMAGGQSASAELAGYWNDVNLEQIAAWNPDVIVIPPYGGATIEAITENPEWQILDAVQQGKVFQMPKLVAPWDTPAPDSVLGIIWLAETLYPDHVGLSCAQEAEYFYNTFYGYDISAEEIARVCGGE